MTALATRLTRTLGVRHPIVLAPMAFAAGGALAAAVTRAGGLGLIGGGYGDAAWLEQQFEAAGASAWVWASSRGRSRRIRRCWGSCCGSVRRR